MRKCDWARLREIGGPALQKKLEFDNKKRAEQEQQGGDKRRSSEEGASPEKGFKSPTSPRKEEVERRKSDQSRRKDEMEYKMFRMSSMQKKSDEKKRKRASSETQGVEVKEEVRATVAPEPSSPVTTFSRSFKVKKEVKIVEDKMPGEEVESGKETVNGSNGGSRAGEIGGGVVVNGEGRGGGGGGGGGGGEGRGVHKDIETETASEGLGEGTLVWAKMRVRFDINILDTRNADLNLPT